MLAPRHKFIEIKNGQMFNDCMAHGSLESLVAFKIKPAYLRPLI
jgi:hypothetical protein